MSNFFDELDFNETYPKLLTAKQAADIANNVLGKRSCILTAEGGSKWLCYGEYKEPDTAEKILSELVTRFEGIKTVDGVWCGSLALRAKKLLEAE